MCDLANISRRFVESIHTGGCRTMCFEVGNILKFNVATTFHSYQRYCKDMGT